jgi:hypothetical protein
MKADGKIDYSWAFKDQADASIINVLGNIPNRWGRMTPLSRLLIVETGRFFQEKGLLARGQRCDEQGKIVGLIGGTRKGSLHTDSAFLATMEGGPGLASPALFGYTLPNIPLAEVASHYGLIGPVYAIFDSHNPFKSAEREARRLMAMQKDLSMMLACEFDHFDDHGEKISVKLTVL